MTKQLFCMTAVAALAAASQVVRADDYAQPDTEQFARYESEQPMTCAQASAFAWFMHELARTDGGSDDLAVAPAECERTYLAKSSDGNDDGDK
jgi:hypothetical protein